jgi:hypothetical protein
MNKYSFILKGRQVAIVFEVDGGTGTIYISWLRDDTLQMLGF